MSQALDDLTASVARLQTQNGVLGSALNAAMDLLDTLKASLDDVSTKLIAALAQSPDPALAALAQQVQAVNDAQQTELDALRARIVRDTPAAPAAPADAAPAAPATDAPAAPQA